MKTVAQTILDQLGGNRFIAMTGAKHLAGDSKTLQFSIGRGAKNGINKVRVLLDDDDLYKVRFFKIRGTDVKLLATVDGVYAERLAEVFTEQTGFDTRL